MSEFMWGLQLASVGQTCGGYGRVKGGCVQHDWDSCEHLILLFIWGTVPNCAFEMDPNQMPACTIM